MIATVPKTPSSTNKSRVSIRRQLTTKRKESGVRQVPLANYSLAGSIRELFGGVAWEPAFLGFLYYIIVIVTNRAPGADVAIVVSLIFLILRPLDLRIGQTLSFLALLTVWAWISYLIGGLNPDVYEGTWELTKIWLVAFVGFNAVRTRAQLRFLFALAVFCFVLYPVRGAFLNYFVINHTAFGRAIWNYAYSNPNDLAAFAIVFGSMAIAFTTLCENRLNRLWGVAAAGVILVLVLFTQSRGAIVGVALVGIWVLITSVRNPRVLVIALLIGAVGMWFAPETLWTRLAGLAKVSIENDMAGVDEEGSAEQRWQVAQIAAQIARDHIGVGVGVGGYAKAHGAYASTVTSELSLAGGNRDAHNTYLRTAAELGLVGLVLFLLELKVGLTDNAQLRGRGSFDKRAISVKPLRLGLIAYMLAGMFGSFGYIVMLHLLLVFIEKLKMTNPHSALLAGSRRLVGNT